VKRAKETGAALPRYVERQLETIEYLTKQIAEADKELAKQAKGSPTCVRLMTVPGVGPLTAVRFVAALDKISRFPSAHKVESYLGLVPGEHQSSYYQQRLSITKAGSPALRHTLVQAAWATRRSKNGQELAAWATEIEKRRGKRVAVVALARKLAGILFAIWRDGTTYKRARAATPPRPTHSP
jgi:transposase